jgi:hypothetical protein
VEAALGQQLVEVVAGYAPRNPRKPGPDLVGVPVADLPEIRVDLAAASALSRDGIELAIACGAHRQLGAVVQQDPELLDVVDRLPGKQRVRPARVVADHAADRASVVGRRVRAERQVVRFGGIAQRIEHHAGFNAGESSRRVDLDDPIHVLREIEHHRHVAALPGQARSSAPRQDRRAVLSADRHRGDDILAVAWDDEADRNLAVVRSVGGIQGPAAAIKPYLATDRLLQVAFELNGPGK